MNTTNNNDNMDNDNNDDNNTNNNNNNNNNNDNNNYNITFNNVIQTDVPSSRTSQSSAQEPFRERRLADIVSVPPTKQYRFGHP